MTELNEASYILPTGWAFASISQLIGTYGLFVDGDWIESKDQNQKGAVKLVQLADLGDGEFKNKSSRYMTSDKAFELNCTFLKFGDILLARMPEPLGRAVIFPFSDLDKFVTVVDVAIIRTGEDSINNKYLMYFINSPHIRKQIHNFQTGTTRKRISRSNLDKILIPIAPLAEQHRIVEKVEELFSELDDSVNSLKKIQRHIKLYRISLLNQAFDGRLTASWRIQNKSERKVETLKNIRLERKKNYLKKIAEWEETKNNKPKKLTEIVNFTEKELSELPLIPDCWKWIKIGEFEDLIGSGSTPSGGKDVYVDSGVPFFRSQNIYPNKLELDNVVFINESTHESMKRSQLMPKDVLLNITGASIGRSAYLPENFIIGNVNQHVCIIRSFTERIFYKFISTYLNSPIAQRIIGEVNSGATREALNFEQVRNFPIPLLTLEEQIEIVNQVESNLSFIDNLDEIIREKLNRSDDLRRSILKNAYEGKLTSQNSDDGYASQLLDQINVNRLKYLAEQKELNLSLVKKVKMKTKQQQQQKIIDILKNSDVSISAKEIWKQSEFKNDIEKFYSELKKIEPKILEVEKGILKLKE